VHDCKPELLRKIKELEKENSSLINEVDAKNAELMKFAKTMMQSKKAYDLTIDKLKKEKLAQEK